MDASRYFDNASTTFLDPRVLEAMLPYLRESGGNPHSLHAWGRAAMDAVDQARYLLASLMRIEDPSQLTFTSGATESNNWFLRSHPDAQVGPFEHSSIREAGEVWGHPIYEPLTQVEALSHMLVNNETGTLFDLGDFRTQAEILHSDMTQGLGKIPLPIELVDFASFSAHKLYGPKGVGAFYARDFAPEPLLVGGGQEDDRRAGTLNVPGIVGFGEAARIAMGEMDADRQHALTLRSILLDELRILPDWEVNGEGPYSPFIVNLSIAGVLGEAVVVGLDALGFGVSSGAACSSGSNEPSPVLVAMGYEPDRARSAVRISFGRSNNMDSTAQLAQALGTVVRGLRTIECPN